MTTSSWVSEPAAFETVKLTVYEPGIVYSWVASAVEAVASSPKSQAQEVGSPDDDR